MLEKSDLNNNNIVDNKKDNINDYIFPQYEEQQIKEAFDVFDFNGNNFISVNELKEIFHYIKEEVTEEELDEMINLADKEGDGQVNWVNFYEFISGKTISPGVKDMKITPGLYPEDKYNEIQHLKKSKIEFMNLNKEINDDKIETKRVNKESRKKNSINNINPKDKTLNENGDKNLKKEKKKKKISIVSNKDEDNDNKNDEFEDDKVDNYVQEILKKRQEKIQNNYFVNKAKIKDLEDKPKKVGKKLIYIDDSKKKQIVTNGSLNESSSEKKSNDSNNNDNNNIDEQNINNDNNNEENKRENKETNQTKISNFLPLDRTNTMRKINPIFQEINNEDEKSEKSIDKFNINKNNKKKGTDSEEENDEDKQNENSFVKKKIINIKITPKKKSKKSN